MKHVKLKNESAEVVRLDHYLSKEITDLSRSYAKKLIEDGNVRLDGKEAKASRLLRGGETIELDVPAPEILDVEPENIPLDILYEDSSIIVVNKAAGMVVHPAPGHYNATLVNALLYHCSDLSGVGGVLRPGIVHRIDAGTTGIIVIAKTDRAHQGLSDQFQQRTVFKEYRAIVFGSVNPENGEINIAIGRDKKDRKKISVQTDIGKEALTRYETVDRWDEFSFLKVQILTGRTHQIRVHFNYLGHPIAGDALYGGKRWKSVNNPQLKKTARNFGRPALHACQIKFSHPLDGSTVSLKADLPDDMKKFIRLLDNST